MQTLQENFLGTPTTLLFLVQPTTQTATHFLLILQHIYRKCNVRNWSWQEGKYSQSQRNYEQNLAEMTPEELSAIIDRWEGEKAAIAKDITPV